MRKFSSTHPVGASASCSEYWAESAWSTPHQLRGDVREPFRPAVVVVDDPGRRGRVGVDVVVGGDGGVAQGLAVVVVERQVGARRIGKVGGDVTRPDLHLPVLHVLWVHEQDVLDQAELLEQHRAHQPVEVTPGDQPISLRAQGAASSSVWAVAHLIEVGRPGRALDR
jgi:hypothetical protein